MDMNGPHHELEELHRRLRFARVGLLLVFMALVFRIWQLQVYEGEYYRNLSEDNRTRTVIRKPARGLIYDRNGALLANNVPSFSLYAILEDIEDRKGTSKKIEELIGLNEDMVREKLSSRGSRFVPRKIGDRLTLRKAALIESNVLELPGLIVQAESQRNYPAGTTGSHLIGYVGEISANQLEQQRFSTLTQGAIVGKYGVEATFDKFLRGQPGKRGVEVDARGHEKRTVLVHKPQAGDDLYLTIDLRLQQLAEELIGVERGAIIAIDPNNGELFALASAPGFDPNVLSRQLTNQEWAQIVNDDAHPLTNRATQGQYPPGSTLKMVMAAAGLETQTVGQHTDVTCTGGYRFGRRTFRDWKYGGHGSVNVHDALVNSCDVYFYALGHRLGIDTMANYFTQFGFGQKTGIELLSERTGIVPSKAWKQRVKGQPWIAGETISVAIGQGFVSVTPIQMAQMTATLANNGTAYRPHLVRAVMERATGRLQEFPVVPKQTLAIKPETFHVIKKAMAGVVTDGTAKRAQSSLVSIAGKTGTAQTASLRRAPRNQELPRKYRDHAWFVAFAPVENPRVALIVLIEHSGHGGSVAAPLAKTFIETFMQLPPIAPVIKPIMPPQTVGQTES